MAKPVKEKDNYFKLTFLIPVVYSVITAILMSVAVARATSVTLDSSNLELAKKLVLWATYSLAVSPSALMITVYLSIRHQKKHPDGSRFYRVRPMALSLIVIGLQVLYMFSLAL